jgi:hypothetical protein
MPSANFFADSPFELGFDGSCKQKTECDSEK